MRRTLDYYFAPQSPWMYLGHARLIEKNIRRAGVNNPIKPFIVQCRWQCFFNFHGCCQHLFRYVIP